MSSEVSVGRMVVVGAGGIGGGIGAMLARTGVEVVLVARGEHGAAIRARGLRVLTPTEAFVARPTCVQRVRDVVFRADDTVLVATKLGDAEAAYEQVLRAAGPRVRVVCGQNGVAAGEWARDRFDDVVHTVIWMPAEYLVAGEVRLYGAPVAGVLDVGPGGEDLAEALRGAGLHSAVRGDIHLLQRAKWMTNLCGLAIASGHRSWCAGLMAEGRRVLQVAGLDVASEDELMSAYGHITAAPIGGVQRLSGGSAAQGLARGRPSEVRWLNGPIVRLGVDLGVPVPLNEAVLRLEDQGGGATPAQRSTAVDTVG